MGDAAAPQPRIHRLDEAVVNRIEAGEIIQAGRV
jgi:DNA mismatch repair ATPase MutL